MSGVFDVKRWWPQPLLPREDGRQISLQFILAVLTFLAGLSLMTALASDRAAEGWRGQLRDAATVVVRPTGLETPDAAAARAAEALAGVRGVTEARAMEPARAEALLARWMGPGPLPADLPVPRLVTLELDRRHPPLSSALEGALRAAGIDATVDDHSVWSGEIMRAGALMRWLALGFFALLAATASAVVVFATRQGLSARRDVVQILHLTGATDSFIASLFQARFARMAAQAGLIGGIAAAGLGALLRLYTPVGGFAPVLPIEWTDLIAPLPSPLVAALIAAVTARLTAVSVLAGRP
jgi:cell division transport system permease protein